MQSFGWRPSRQRPLVCAVRFPFICASPRILKLLRSFLDSKVPFTHVLCRCDPIVGIVDLYIVDEPFTLRSFPWSFGEMRKNAISPRKNDKFGCNPRVHQDWKWPTPTPYMNPFLGPDFLNKKRKFLFYCFSFELPFSLVCLGPKARERERRLLAEHDLKTLLP